MTEEVSSLPCRKNLMEAELVRSKNDMMSLNNQLLEAIQRKLELSQELEAWQVGTHYPNSFNHYFMWLQYYTLHYHYSYPFTRLFWLDCLSPVSSVGCQGLMQSNLCHQFAGIWTAGVSVYKAFCCWVTMPSQTICHSVWAAVFWWR